MKSLIAIAFVLILSSLGVALFFLMRRNGTGNRHRTVQALAVRVALSITLFLILLGSYSMGWIAPTGLH